MQGFSFLTNPIKANLFIYLTKIRGKIRFIDSIKDNEYYYQYALKTFNKPILVEWK